MTNLVAALAGLADEPIISKENEETLQKIIQIERTSEFEPMNLNDEKLDELVGCLREQEDFAKEIPLIAKGLERVPSIVLIEEAEEEEYI